MDLMRERQFVSSSALQEEIKAEGEKKEPWKRESVDLRVSKARKWAPRLV